MIAISVRLASTAYVRDAKLEDAESMKICAASYQLADLVRNFLTYGT